MIHLVPKGHFYLLCLVFFICLFVFLFGSCRSSKITKLTSLTVMDILDFFLIIAISLTFGFILLFSSPFQIELEFFS